MAQGFNDPRVPYTEAEQIVSKVRGNGGDVWYLLFKDEGHGSRVVNSLSVRVILTALTVALIAWGFYSGQLVSHVTW